MGLKTLVKRLLKYLSTKYFLYPIVCQCKFLFFLRECEVTKCRELEQ